MAKAANPKPATEAATAPVATTPPVEGAGTPPAEETSNTPATEQATPPVEETNPPVGTDKAKQEEEIEGTEELAFSDYGVVEMEVARINTEPDGSEFVYMRAVEHPDTSGEFLNGEWGGAKPRAIMEIVIVAGSLLGELKAGQRVEVSISPVQPDATIVM